MKTQEVKPLTEPREAKTIELDRHVNGVRFSPSGKHLVASGFDALVRRWLWNDGKLKEQPSLEGHRGWVTVLTFAPQEPVLFTADSWGGLIAWPYQKEAARPLWKINDAHNGWIRSLAVSADGQSLISGGHDGFVRVFNAKTGKLLREMNHGEDVFAVAVHPEGKLAVSGDLFGKLKVWDLGTGKFVREMDCGSLHYYQRDQDVAGLRVLDFQDGGKTLIAAGSEPTSTGRGLGIPTIRFFDWATGKPQETLHQGESNDGFVFDLARHQDFYMTVTSGQPGRGQWVFHRPGEEKPFWTYKKMSNCHSLAIHPSGRHAVVSATNRKSQGNGAVKDKDGKYLGNFSPLHIFELPEKPTGDQPA